MSNIVPIESSIYGAQDSFAAVLIDRSISFDREAEFATQALYGNDFAMKIALQNRQSVINAVVNIAAIGISLNPAKRQAYLVPRDGKICLDISYMGLMDLAIDSGAIRWAQAEIVRESDAFVLNGFDKPPSHSYSPFSSNRGEVVGAYVVVKTASGDYLTTCMSRDEIDGAMNRSQSVKSGKSSPWKTDWCEMAKKTVVKRAYKYWPKSDRLDAAIHHLNTDSGEGLATVAAGKYISAAPEGSPEREAALEEATAIAESGYPALEAWWKHADNKPKRQLIQDQLNSLKESARAADAARDSAEAAAGAEHV